MSKIILDEEAGRAAVFGGTVLGGGGGGTIASGLERVKIAISMGQPFLVSLNDLEDNDLVITASAVGAPAAKDRFFLPVDAIKAMELIQTKFDKPIAGVIANENGPASGVNGWLQSAIMKIPVVDAPANGRAHPTGMMGAMGIHLLEDYRSIQAAVGGNPGTGKYLEMVVEGRLDVTAKLVRQAAVHSGGLVMVARDPLPVSYLKENAAPGATSSAIEIGRTMIDAMDRGAEAVIDAIVSSTGGRIFCQGKVRNLTLKTDGGYDLGSLSVNADQVADLTFWNEYMTVEVEGERHATFPDLISLISMNTGLPLASAEIREGDDVGVLVVPREKLILGKGVLLPEAIKEAEDAIQKPLFAI
ncbi:MAG: DUF917 family protein [Arenicella sp.]|nr:DUF917 family protein [Arenicella sp.]